MEPDNLEQLEDVDQSLSGARADVGSLTAFGEDVELELLERTRFRRQDLLFVVGSSSRSTTDSW